MRDKAIICVGKASDSSFQQLFGSNIVPYLCVLLTIQVDELRFFLFVGFISGVAIGLLSVALFFVGVNYGKSVISQVMKEKNEISKPSLISTVLKPVAQGASGFVLS